MIKMSINLAKLREINLTVSRLSSLISLGILGLLVGGLSSCRDFNRFECFQNENGCSPRVQVTSGSEVLVNDLNPSHPDYDEDDMEREAGELIGGIGFYDVSVGGEGAGNSISGELNAGEFGGMISGEMTSGTIVSGGESGGQAGIEVGGTTVVRPAPCIPSNIVTDTWIIPEAEFIWTCVVSETHHFEIMTTELLNIQLNSLKTLIPVGDPQYEKLAMTPSSTYQIQGPIVNRLPTVISQDAAIELVNLLNSAVNPMSAYYSYSIPTESEWYLLYGDTRLTSCYYRFNLPNSSRNPIGAVLNLQPNTSNGCNFDRPRALLDKTTSDIQLTQSSHSVDVNYICSEDVNPIEVRNHGPHQLCDLVGNLSELVQVSNPNPGEPHYKYLGSHWRSVNINMPDLNDYQDVQGLRLIRRLKNENLP